MTLRLAAAGLTLLFTVSASAGNRVAVLDAKLTKMDGSLGGILTEVISAEVNSYGTHEVVAGRDIEAMLGFEKQKELLGCNDVSCMAELGGALGVDFLLASEFAALGGTYIVNVKLIDIKGASVSKRAYETVKGEQDVLLTTVKRVLAKLFGRKGPATAKAEPKPKREVEKKAPPPPKPPPPLKLKEARSDGGTTPASPPEAAPAASTGSKTKRTPHVRFGASVGVGQGSSKIEAKAADVFNGNPQPLYRPPPWERNGFQAPLLTLFLRTKWIDLDLFAMPPTTIVSGVGIGVDSQFLSLGKVRVGLGIRLALLDAKIPLDAQDDSGRFGPDEDAVYNTEIVAFGVSLKAANRFRAGVYTGPSKNRLSVTGIEFDFNEADAPKAPLMVNLEYFFTDRLVARIDFFSALGRLTDERIVNWFHQDPDLDPLEPANMQDTYAELSTILFSLGFDFSDLMGM